MQVRDVAPSDPPAAGLAKPDDGAHFVHWLSELSRDDTPRVGGKGANLGEMTRAGLPVPPAFVIDIGAYDRFRECTGLGAELDARLSQIDVDDTNALQQLSGEIRALVENGPFPEDLAQRYDACRLSQQTGWMTSRLRCAHRRPPGGAVLVRWDVREPNVRGRARLLSA
jgi:phosphoenolpyruvate synthase/pyruvate phosphate dikinase